jgi:hypothetical protein
MPAPAAPTLTLDPDDELAIVTATVGVPADATSLYLERVDVLGVATYVRGAFALTVTPSSSVDVVDYEAPVGEPLTYRAFVANDASEQSTTTTAGPVELEGDEDPWLVDLVEPENSQQVIVERLAELVVVVPTGVHYVLGRRAPIVTADVAKAPSFELVFVTLDALAREKARATLGTGVPVLLRTLPEQGVGLLYLSVVGWAEQRPSRLAVHAERRFVVQGQEVDAPAATLYAPPVSV